MTNNGTLSLANCVGCSTDRHACILALGDFGTVPRIPMCACADDRRCHAALIHHHVRVHTHCIAAEVVITAFSCIKFHYYYSHYSGAGEANHEQQSPDTGSEHVASTPPPGGVERSESVFSSASKHYLSLSRLNSIFPVSRSSSESLTSSTPMLPIIKKSRVDSIHENIGRIEKVLASSRL